MTSQAQVAANRANAKRSTGPKSASGKANVARNAVRHGATRAPDPEQVIDWFRVIRGMPELGTADILEDDDTTRLALSLAGAEAQLSSAQAALDEFRASPNVLSRDSDLQNLVEIAGECMALDAGAREEDEIEHYIVKARHEFLGKFNARFYFIEMRLLRRYLREAQSKRKRAFGDWIEHLLQTRDGSGQAKITN